MTKASETEYGAFAPITAQIIIGGDFVTEVEGCVLTTPYSPEAAYVATLTWDKTARKHVPGTILGGIYGMDPPKDAIEHGIHDALWGEAHSLTTRIALEEAFEAFTRGRKEYAADVARDLQKAG